MTYFSAALGGQAVLFSFSSRDQLCMVSPSGPAKAQRLLQGGYPVACKAAFSNSPAYWAIAQGDMEALRLLIRFGLDVNYDWGEGHGNLLTNAVQFGHLEQVQILVESGASVIRDPKRGRSPLYAAVIYDQRVIESYLRGRGAQFNQWDTEAFRVLKMNP